VILVIIFLQPPGMLVRPFCRQAQGMTYNTKGLFYVQIPFFFITGMLPVTRATQRAHLLLSYRTSLVKYFLNQINRVQLWVKIQKNVSRWGISGEFFSKQGIMY
jgi:hypothetical protein